MSEEQNSLNEVLKKSSQNRTPEEDKKTEPEQQEPAAEKSPEPAADPKPEPKDESKPEPEEEPKPEPAAEPKPAPETQSKPEFQKGGFQHGRKGDSRIRERPIKKKIDENIVLVGKKPTMNYVLAAVTQFSDGIEEVHIKARGRNISRAVDVAEVVRKRFMQNINTNISIGTDEITDENNNKINVSTIDIALKK